MKKGFSLVELIISVGLISLVLVFSLFVVKTTDTSYADPYEELRKTISDATYLFLNLNKGEDYKNELYENNYVSINTNLLIAEGLLEEVYYVENINDNKNLKNIPINITLDSEGLINYLIIIE